MASEYYHIYFNFTALSKCHSYDTTLGAITHMAFNHFIFINFPAYAGECFHGNFAMLLKPSDAAAVRIQVSTLQRGRVVGILRRVY